MNRTELIEKIMYDGGIVKDSPLGRELINSLAKNLPDFQRIDEERMGKILNNIVGSSIYYDQLLQKSVTLEAVRIYNSTLSKAPAQPPALKPLPKEMPEWFDKKVSEWMNNSNIRLNQVWQDIISNYGTPANNLQPLPKEMPEWFKTLWRSIGMMDWQREDAWKHMIQHYGTPEPKPELPTVEELAKEIAGISVPIVADKKLSRVTAEYIIDKYSLHNREWWQDLKEGDKFMYAGQVYEYYGYEVNHRCEVTLWGKSTWKFRLSGCTPYTTPTADDIIAKHNLSEEEIKIIKQS